MCEYFFLFLLFCDGNFNPFQLFSSHKNHHILVAFLMKRVKNMKLSDCLFFCLSACLSIFLFVCHLFILRCRFCSFFCLSVCFLSYCVHLLTFKLSSKKALLNIWHVILLNSTTFLSLHACSIECGRILFCVLTIIRGREIGKMCGIKDGNCCSFNDDSSVGQNAMYFVKCVSMKLHITVSQFKTNATFEQ
jgi:hypothetical protein